MIQMYKFEIFKRVMLARSFVVNFQENDSKKARALKKAEEERDSKKQKDKEIDK